ncbi:DUF1428 domain-containing protein [Massilia yuzhufengensis]|uniref:Uncharacterized conserved protein YbaA, DUF1428 family n=1 Tax=Massilia yuzhufengensis TaxID=1164594 RepID=A0A1I1K7B4_9BURK|nr:DUF1428 domain-containing protein [Massilia yuzhufengensis]SFC56441.1 Uncharacterized conserved protein YbaA, DUF1428 family [Massilia yuzhufengensis]
MSYIDCFMAPVPRANMAAYEALARLSAKVVKEYGALSVMECWIDEAGPDAQTYHGTETRQSQVEYPSFVTAAGAGPDDTVVISYVAWPDKATRDTGMEKLTSDPRMQFGGQAPVFDGKRLTAAGFRPIPGLDEA